MADVRTLEAVVTKQLAAGGRVLLVGDHRQLPEVGAGGGFAYAATHAPVVAELTVNRRQRQPWEQAALAELRSGTSPPPSPPTSPTTASSSPTPPTPCSPLRSTGGWPPATHGLRAGAAGRHQRPRRPAQRRRDRTTRRRRRARRRGRRPTGRAVSGSASGSWCAATPPNPPSPAAVEIANGQPATSPPPARAARRPPRHRPRRRPRRPLPAPGRPGHRRLRAHHPPGPRRHLGPGHRRRRRRPLPRRRLRRAVPRCARELDRAHRPRSRPSHPPSRRRARTPRPRARPPDEQPDPVEDDLITRIDRSRAKQLAHSIDPDADLVDRLATTLPYRHLAVAPRRRPPGRSTRRHVLGGHISEVSERVERTEHAARHLGHRTDRQPPRPPQHRHRHRHRRPRRDRHRAFHLRRRSASDQDVRLGRAAHRRPPPPTTALARAPEPTSTGCTTSSNSTPHDGTASCTPSASNPATPTATGEPPARSSNGTPTPSSPAHRLAHRPPRRPPRRPRRRPHLARRRHRHRHLAARPRPPPTTHQGSAPAPPNRTTRAAFDALTEELARTRLWLADTGASLSFPPSCRPTEASTSGSSSSTSCSPPARPTCGQPSPSCRPASSASTTPTTCSVKRSTATTPDGPGSSPTGPTSSNTKRSSTPCKPILNCSSKPLASTSTCDFRDPATSHASKTAADGPVLSGWSPPIRSSVPMDPMTTRPMSASRAAPAVARTSRPPDVHRRGSSRLLGISRTTAYECVRDGSLPALRFRRRVVITRAAIEALLAKGKPTDA